MRVRRCTGREQGRGTKEETIPIKRAISLGLWPALFTLALVALLLGCPALSPGATPRLVSDESWFVARYDSLPANVKREIDRYATLPEYEASRRDPRFELRRWKYRSDSLTVVAYAYRRKPVAGEKPMRRPAVIYCRGSYLQDGLSPASVALLHRLGEAGFLAVAPQYRGSEGGEGRDEMGGRDVRDVTALVELLARDPGVDPKRLYLYGESRGGMMAYQAARDGARVRAIATVGAFTDMDTLLARDPVSAKAASQIWPDWPANRAALSERRSAIRWVGKIRVPTLVLVGQFDTRVLPADEERFVAALKRQGTPAEFRMIENASHTIGERSKMRDSLVVDWFRRYGAKP